MWPRKSKQPDLHAADRALARRLQAGDEEAFEHFFDTHFDPLYRFAFSRVDQDAELAKEIAQATLCKAFEKIGTYRGEAALFSWLCSICRFEISGHFRRARQAPPALSFAEDSDPVRGVLDSLASEADDPENALLRREVTRLVHLTVDHLPSHYGQILEWKYSDGLSVKEIAERLDTSPKAAESLLTRARLAFRDGFAALAGTLKPDAFEAGG